MKTYTELRNGIYKCDKCGKIVKAPRHLNHDCETYLARNQNTDEILPDIA